MIRDYLGTEERRLNGTFRSEAAIYLLAERADMHGDTLQKIVVGRSKTIDFDVADRLLCVLGKADCWRGELQEVYAQAKLDDGRKQRTTVKPSKAKRCARRGCSVQFVPSKHGPKQRFCSNACRNSAWKLSKGMKTGPRGPGRSLEAFACRNHHERTPENTGTNSRGHRYCLTCHRDSMRRQRAKKRSA